MVSIVGLNLSKPECITQKMSLGVLLLTPGSQAHFIVSMHNIVRERPGQRC